MKGICDNTIEFQCWTHSRLLIGMDEAGRGPLAGPLVVAGVIFPKDYTNMQKLDYSYIYSTMMYISLIAAAFRSKLIKMQNSYDSEEPSSRKIIKYIKELRKTNLDCISWQILDKRESSRSARVIFLWITSILNSSLQSTLLRAIWKV